MGYQGTDRNTDRPQGIGHSDKFIKINRVIPCTPLVTERHAGSHARSKTHSHMHTERQTVRMTLPFEFTTLGWSKSLSPAFFALTNSGGGGGVFGTSQNLYSCSTTADFYNREDRGKMIHFFEIFLSFFYDGYILLL